MKVNKTLIHILKRVKFVNLSSHFKTWEICQQCLQYTDQDFRGHLAHSNGLDKKHMIPHSAKVESFYPFPIMALDAVDL